MAAAAAIGDDSQFFDSLLTLIPSKYYLHKEAEEDELAWNKYYRVRAADAGSLRGGGAGC